MESTFTLTRQTRAVSGKTKETTFNIGTPTKFLKLNLPDNDIVEILSCTDSNGNKWYEVDYLAQEKVLKETHYNNDSTRDNAYDKERLLMILHLYQYHMLPNI